MSVLSKKDRIIVSVAYILLACFTAYYYSNLFTFVYFFLIGLVICFADKVLQTEPHVLCFFSMTFIAAMLHNVFYEKIFVTSGDLLKLIASCSPAVFLFGFYAVLRKKNQWYAVLSAIIFLVVDFKIGLCFGTLILCISLFNLYTTKLCANDDKKQKKKQKRKNKKKQKTVDLNILIAITGLITTVICILLSLKPENHSVEMVHYFFINFKNCIFAVPALAYLLVRALKQAPDVRLPVIVGTVFMIAISVFGVMSTGWKTFALTWLCILVFVGYCCVQKSEVTTRLKADFEKNKLIFIVFAVALLL